jgi:hypothetical protein
MVGVIPWIAYSLWYYFGNCTPYTDSSIHCYFDSKSMPTYYTPGKFFSDLIVSITDVPILAFLVGAVALRVGSWIAKGFRPSQPQPGE